MKIIKSEKLEKWQKYKKTAKIKTLTKEEAKKSSGVHEFEGKNIPFVSEDDMVETLEGPQEIKDGDLLCKGIIGELWPQPENKVKTKFTKDEYQGNRSIDPWTSWTPKGKIIEAIQLKEDKKVNNMNGKIGDYMLRDPENQDDKWIVQKDIFEKSYKKED